MATLHCNPLRRRLHRRDATARPRTSTLARVAFANKDGLVSPELGYGGVVPTHIRASFFARYRSTGFPGVVREGPVLVEPKDLPLSGTITIASVVVDRGFVQEEASIRRFNEGVAIRHPLLLVEEEDVAVDLKEAHLHDGQATLVLDDG